ncbi:MAG: D-alanyl-D-alanine carboxypeptidase [Pyrinomonadaceae bacterium]|nr:D-alanyl-D-alanine carboxypeptidase [Pyrinomonadaceae bacterium]
MKKIFTSTGLVLFTALIAIGFVLPTELRAQQKPLLQPIVVVTDKTAAIPTATPLIKKTGVSSPIARKTSIAALSDVNIPGYSGVLIESLDGRVVVEDNSEEAFNPASNVKIATAYAVLKVFGPDFRFPTHVWTDGQIDNSTGTLYGNLYVSGRDPIFNYEHAVMIAHELNRLGIKTVNGDLIVTGDFVMNYNANAQRAGNNLYATLDPAKRSSAATRAWTNFLINSVKLSQITQVPGVSISGSMYVQTVPNTAKLLFSHESAPMRAIVKATLCYSNNFLSERLGDMLGGHYAVARIVHLNANVAPEDFILASSSGLGVNRVTPRAMMSLLRAFRNDLARMDMTFADIMPVAGIDRGTLEGRFDSDFARGSVVGKTGTLGRTDGGVSTLAGEIQTKSGKLLFVIFNQRGGVRSFRNFQNSFVSLVQSQLGGADSLGYAHIPIDVRLATSRVIYPNNRDRRVD